MKIIKRIWNNLFPKYKMVVGAYSFKTNKKQAMPFLSEEEYIRAMSYYHMTLLEDMLMLRGLNSRQIGIINTLKKCFKECVYVSSRNGRAEKSGYTYAQKEFKNLCNLRVGDERLCKLK